MPPIFTQDGQAYIAESANFSRIWSLWIPLAVLIIVPIWAYLSQDTYKLYIEEELYGFLELSHAILPIIAGFIALRLLFIRQIRQDWLVAGTVAVLLAGSIYLAGEELSWGQHHFGWATPEYWSSVNKQDETNIHNTSRWLNHIPRGVLTVMIIIGGTILPWVKVNRPQWTFKRIDFLVPPQALYALSIMVLVQELMVQFGNFHRLRTIVHYHDGELQEFHIAAAILLYAVFLMKRSKQL